MSSSITTLDALVRHSSARLEAFMASQFAKMVQGDALESEPRRRVFLACVRRFSINFQRLLFLRQGLCTDPLFYPMFMRHLNDEFGHDKLLADDGMPEPICDTVFEAILGWFNYQMIVLDNADRAALMHMVLEAGGDRLHLLTAVRLGDKVDSPYFQTHAELDAGHAQMAAAALAGLAPSTYERLGRCVDDGWDMLDAIVERVRQLVLACP